MNFPGLPWAKSRLPQRSDDAAQGQQALVDGAAPRGDFWSMGGCRQNDELMTNIAMFNGIL